jgi:hypothetical protein
MKNEITPKQAFDLGVERQRAMKRIAKQLTEEMNTLSDYEFWDRLDVAYVDC